MSINEFIYNSRKVEKADELFFLYQNLLEQHGFDQLVYAITSGHPELSNNHELGVVLNKGCQHWQDHYRENNYLIQDYIYEYCITRSGVANWDKILKEKPLTKLQKQILDEAKEAKLFNGMTISVHGINKTQSSLVLSSSQRELDVNQQTEDVLNLASIQFHNCYVSLMDITEPPPLETLTFKEKEILKWAAKGFTKVDIGKQIYMSPHTVDFHLRNIYKKMDTKNISGALIKAIQEGMISIW